MANSFPRVFLAALHCDIGPRLFAYSALQRHEKMCRNDSCKQLQIGNAWIIDQAEKHTFAQQFCAMAEMAEEGFVDVSKEQDGGLLKKILVEGKGEDTPSPGSSVDVHYVGTLHSDGSKFDSSRDRPGTFKFEVGVGQVIKGWDQGILTMKRGEKCILRCRSDYAYGQNGSPPKIPGDATLNFEVELFDWKEKVKTPAEMTPEERRDHATKMKEAGTEAFKQGDFATAVNR